MKSKVFLVMVNPLGDYWRILGESSRFDQASVIPECYDSFEKAEERAWEKAQKMSCEVRVVLLTTQAVYKAQPVQVEIEKTIPQERDWREDDLGQPTTRL